MLTDTEARLQIVRALMRQARAALETVDEAMRATGIAEIESGHVVKRLRKAKQEVALMINALDTDNELKSKIYDEQQREVNR